MTPSEAMDLLYHLGFCDRLQDCTCGLTEGIRRVEAAVRAQQAAEVERLRAALEELTCHWDAMAGQRAHRLGCECSGTPDGKHSCASLTDAIVAARAALSATPVAPEEATR